MKNKRGISTIVATVLVILITVAAVTIIWAAVIPMIKRNLEGGTMCMDAVSQVSIETQGGYTCWDATDGGSCSNSSSGCDSETDCEETSCNGTWTSSGTVKIQISHGAKSFELADIQVLISEGGDTTTVLLVEDEDYDVETDLPGTNEEKVFEVSYEATTTAGPDKVEIAPIVKVGQTTETCDISASATLSEC